MLKTVYFLPIQPYLHLKTLHHQNLLVFIYENILKRIISWKLYNKWHDLEAIYSKRVSCCKSCYFGLIYSFVVFS